MMKKIIYVIVRYSVLIEKSKSWTITDPNLDEYRKNLFDENRLKSRLKLFSSITLPSLLGQEVFIKDNNVKLIIISSENLPEWNKEELNNLVMDHEWISTHYLPSKGTSLVQPVYDDLKSHNEEVLYATIRLDDDDALSIDFFKEFSNFLIPSNIGYAISFGKGLCGFFDFENSQYYKVIDYYYPKLALGLGYINLFDGKSFKNKIKTIFQAGGHTKVDQYVPTIVYSKNIMYLRTMYESSDSHENERFKRLKKLPPVEVSVLQDRFSITSFDKKRYIESNSNAAYNLDIVDRTRYNKRYDILEGTRIYNYIYNNIDISFLSKFVSNSEKLTIILSEEVDRNKINYNYSMFPLVSDIEGSVFYFLDPTINLSNNISIGWFQGNKDNYALPILIRFINQLLETNNIDPTNLTILGTSAGGFSSLKIANEFPNSRIVVVNPQTYIFNYSYKEYEKIVDWIFPELTPEQAKEIHNKRLKITLSIENRSLPILYYQNLEDGHHLHHHLYPLLETLSKDDYEIVDSIDQKFITDKKMKVIYYSDPESGHSPLGRVDTVNILNGKK